MKLFLLFYLIAFINLQASVSMGKKVFSQECASCHGEGKYFAANKKAKEWSKLLKTDTLKTLHQDINISLPYLQSKKFHEEKKHLKALLQKYSLDRGKHNSCY